MELCWLVLVLGTLVGSNYGAVLELVNVETAVPGRECCGGDGGSPILVPFLFSCSPNEDGRNGERERASLDGKRHF